MNGGYHDLFKGPNFPLSHYGLSGQNDRDEKGDGGDHSRDIKEPALEIWIEPNPMLQLYARFLEADHADSIQPFYKNLRREFRKDLVRIAQRDQRRIRFTPVENNLNRGRVPFFQLSRKIGGDLDADRDFPLINEVFDFFRGIGKRNDIKIF
jgi:hypothetical protein